MENREDANFYTCYKCSKNFQSKKCPKCGKNGTPIYEEQTNGRPNNNPTDIESFLKNRRSSN